MTGIAKLNGMCYWLKYLINTNLILKLYYTKIRNKISQYLVNRILPKTRAGLVDKNDVNTAEENV